MAEHIKTKNLKLNTNINEDKRIFEYFDDNKEENFSKITKDLLLKYIDGEFNIDSKSVIKMLENNTKLLEQLIETGVKVDSSFSKDLNISKIESIDSKEENEEDNCNFNMDFLNQIK